MCYNAPMSAEIDQEIINARKIDFIYGAINLNQKDLEFSWDLDQTLALTEDPVKAAIDAKFGTKYSLRRTDGWNTISKWLIADGIDQKDADEAELKWRENEVLVQAKPNEYLRWLSFAAFQRGIPQSITTVRSSGLRQMTYKWVEKYYWWIPAGKLNFKIPMGHGDEFKIERILERYKKNPGLIHWDDDLTIIRPLAKLAPELGIIGIKYPSDDVDGLNHSPNRVFIERDMLNSLIYHHFSEAEILEAKK